MSAKLGWSLYSEKGNRKNRWDPVWKETQLGWVSPGLVKCIYHAEDLYRWISPDQAEAYQHIYIHYCMVMSHEHQLLTIDHVFESLNNSFERRTSMVQVYVNALCSSPYTCPRRIPPPETHSQWLLPQHHALTFWPSACCSQWLGAILRTSTKCYIYPNQILSNKISQCEIAWETLYT